MPSLERLIERFIQHEVEFVVVGGYAAMLHGSTYITHDVDVCCILEGDNLYRIFTAIADLRPFHRMTPQEMPFVVEKGTARRFNNLYLKTDLGQIDLLGSIPQGDFAYAKSHSTPIQLPFGQCRLLDIPALIQSKEMVGRSKDFLVTAQLRAILDATTSTPPHSNESH